MQIQNDYSEGGSNLFLTEPPLCPGQNLKGKKTDDEFYESLSNEYELRLKKDYPYHLEFLTLDELKEYVSLEFFINTHPNYSHIKFLKQERLQELEDKINYEYVVMKTEEDFQKLKHLKILEKKNQPKNRYELGAREFTFTYSPKWEGYNEIYARDLMTKGMKKILRTYKNEIIQLRAVGEVGKNGLSHIHCFYKLRGGVKITDKNFQRAWPMWDTHIKQGPTGHRGGHHATVRSETDFQGYIDKDIENAWYEVDVDNSADPTN